jgi:phosphoglucosamine mutase
MSSKKEKKLFGTDGVRGRANYGPMTVETALALGRAVGCVFRRHDGKHRVVIGKDTRLSCYMFENALIAGLCSMGVDTLMVGPLPTPGVAFITRAYRADAGIVISASHNPFHDNGIKIFSADGYKLPDEMELEIEELVFSGNFESHLPEDTGIGRNTKVDDADGRYIEFVKATFPKKRSLKGVTIALDCANGSGYRVAPHVFRELDAKVHSLGIEPNGLNINLNCGALHPEEVQKAVITHHADIGIALDGDADRVILVDENAQVIDGDTILAICAYDLKQKGLLNNDCVVATVMSNLGLIKAMEKYGIRVIQASVGDRHVIKEMIDHGANLGGEQSGHIIFSDHNSTGDALVCALQVLRIMGETGQKLSELAKIVTRYPQALVNVPVSTKPPIDQMKAIRSEIDRVEAEISGSGRVFVRYSGTENICRVMVEGPMQKAVQEYASAIAGKIKEEIGS